MSKTSEMFASRNPSLRHFAVIERTQRSLIGSTWLVQDRRNPLRKQFLFVPSRFRSWPIWLSRLEMLEPTPTRLRNGRVAILLSAPDAKCIKNELKNKAKTGVFKLNAMTGFESDQPKSKIRTVILPALALCMCLLFFIPKDQSAATQVAKQIPKEKQEIACASPIASGSQVLGKLEMLGLIYIQDNRYKIASFQRLGGLAQVKLKRVCDKTYLRVDLWSDGAQLRVEKVY